MSRLFPASSASRSKRRSLIHDFSRIIAGPHHPLSLSHLVLFPFSPLFPFLARYPHHRAVRDPFLSEILPPIRVPRGHLSRDSGFSGGIAGSNGIGDDVFVICAPRTPRGQRRTTVASLPFSLDGRGELFAGRLLCVSFRYLRTIGIEDTSNHPTFHSSFKHYDARFSTKQPFKRSSTTRIIQHPCISSSCAKPLLQSSHPTSISKHLGKRYYNQYNP